MSSPRTRHQHQALEYGLWTKNKDQDQDQMEFVINALKEFDQKGKERAQDQETMARIIEVDEQDFLQRM